jgi:hypothetical protein
MVLATGRDVSVKDVTEGQLLSLFSVASTAKLANSDNPMRDGLPRYRTSSGWTLF